jgi:spore maturation protein CgeB
LGTNPKIRHPTTLPLDDRKKYGADIAFVGSSMAEQSRKLFKIFVDIAAKRGFQPDPGFIGKRILDLQSSLSDKDTIDQVLHEYLQLDDESSCVLPDSDGRLVDLASCVGEAAASQRRLQITSDLAARGFDVAVWGDNGWTTAVSSGVRYRGPANHGHELTCIYNAAKIHLDIDRLYQNDIVTMRVFDILACKGFVLAALSSDLVELFRLDLEVIAYRSMEELAKLAQHFLQNDEDRRQIANAGYERVLKDHTILQRVRSILQHLP